MNAATTEDKNDHIVECLHRIDSTGNLRNNARVATLVANPKSKLYLLNKTPKFHIDALLRLLDLQKFSSHRIVLDPCAGSNTIIQRVQECYLGLKFISNDANKSIEDVDQHKSRFFSNAYTWERMTPESRTSSS